jgi:hypothetical protein
MIRYSFTEKLDEDSAQSKKNMLQCNIANYGELSSASQAYFAALHHF